MSDRGTARGRGRTLPWGLTLPGLPMRLALGGGLLWAMALPPMLLWLTAPEGGDVPATRRGAAPLDAPPPGAALTAIYARGLLAYPLDAGNDRAAMPADAPQLSGIVGRIDRDAVALVRAADGSTRTLAPGESIDGWRLESLALDAAFFTRGGQRLRVALPTENGTPDDPAASPQMDQ